MRLYLLNIVTDPFFILFIAAALGSVIGRIKIKSFSLGSSGGIFAGIVIGWAVETYFRNVSEGDVAYSYGKSILSSGIVPQSFLSFFLLLFICAIGLMVGRNIGSVLKEHGVKLISVGIMIPIISMGVTFCCILVAPRLMGARYNVYEISGLFSGAMTNTAAYGASMDIVDSKNDVRERYAGLSDTEKMRVLTMIGEEGELDLPNMPDLSDEQAEKFFMAAKASISLGYAVTFPAGVMVNR